MKVSVLFNATNMTKEDLRGLIQVIREWELRTTRTQIVGILIDTDPKMTMAESKQIFEGIFPQFQTLVDMPLPQGKVLRLGNRAVAIDGEIVGTVEELTLSIGESGPEAVKKLEEARTIELVRIERG